MFRRMHFGKEGEEIAIESCGIGHAGIAEEQGKNRGHGDPENHGGDEVGGAGAVEALDEKAGDEGSVLGCGTGDDAEKAGMEGGIQHGDAKDRKENAARDIFFGIANFATEMADVVVAPVAVNRVDHGGAEPGEPKRGEMKRAGRKIEREVWIEVANASPDEPEHCGNDANP